MTRRTWIALIVGAALALALALFTGVDADPNKAIAEFRQPDSQFVRISNGTIVHARISGPADAPPLVLLHGFASSAWAWDGWEAQLASRYRIVRLDLPCHGLTVTGRRAAANPGDPSFLKETLDALGLHRVALAGNSLGGVTAARFAALYPDRVSALILIDAPGPRAGAPFRVKALATRWYAPLARLAARWGRIPTAHRQDIFWRLHRADLLRAAPQELSAPPVRIEDIVAPTLVLQGDADRQVPRADAEAWAAGIEGARLTIFPHLGHTPHEEDPVTTAAAALNFLEGRE